MSEAPAGRHPQSGRGHTHHLHSATRRAIYAFCLVSIVVVAGTIGMHALEDMSYLDAFYFVSMLATAQGAAYTPETAAGKIFAAVLAYVSVGIVVAALGVLFGPFFGRLWRVGAIRHDEELARLNRPKSP